MQRNQQAKYLVSIQHQNETLLRKNDRGNKNILFADNLQQKRKEGISKTLFVLFRHLESYDPLHTTNDQDLLKNSLKALKHAKEGETSLLVSKLVHIRHF